MANVGVLTIENKVIIPPFTHTIAGTTALKCMKFLNSEGYEIIQELCKFEDIKDKISEIFIMGG